MSNYINGIAASDGVAIAKAYLLVEPDLSYDSEKIRDVDAEIAKFQNAIETSKVELTKLEIMLKKSWC